MNIKSQIELIRRHPTIPFGIDKKLSGFMFDGTPVKLKSYDGRLVYIVGKKQIGYATMKKQPKCKIVIGKIEDKLPF